MHEHPEGKHVPDCSTPETAFFEDLPEGVSSEQVGEGSPSKFFIRVKRMQTIDQNPHCMCVLLLAKRMTCCPSQVVRLHGLYLAGNHDFPTTVSPPRGVGPLI